MADEGKPPAGRGSGSGRGAPRKAKFAPTVPSQRRRKADDGAAGSNAAAPSAAEAAAANEAFQDLIRAAQSESKWQRGRGRGFGRGRGAGAAITVMFGGDDHDMRRTAAAPPPRAAPKPPPKGEGKAGVKGEAGSSSVRRRLKPKVDGDAAAGGYGGFEDAGDDSGSDGGQQDIASLFDYELYFPTTLPVSLHHPCDEEADAAADAAVMRRGLPVELALKEDDPEGAAARQLGLSDLSTAADTLYLFQLPSILPLGVTPDSSRNKQAAAAAAAGSSHQPPQPLRAAAPRELPSGSSGKLLVFKSGRVKLQVGGCLLDVTAGMPCVSRQDVAAVNKSTGHLIQLGPVTQRAVVSPDVWQLMADQEVPEFRRDLHGGGAPVTNGFGRGDGMDIDGDDDLLDDGEGVEFVPGVRVRARRQQQQVVLGSEEGSEEGAGEQQPGVKTEQGQQQGEQEMDGSSEGDGSPSPEAPAASDAVKQQEQQQQAAPAAAAVPPKQPVQQQQQSGGLGWLDLPPAPTARGVAGRGRGKFRPSTRSPSPALAGGAAAAAGAGGGGVKTEGDAMDVDS